MRCWRRGGDPPPPPGVRRGAGKAPLPLRAGRDTGGLWRVEPVRVHSGVRQSVVAPVLDVLYPTGRRRDGQVTDKGYWEAASRRPLSIFVSTCSCAPRVFRRASQGPQGRVVPASGVHGKARKGSSVTYCSQQRRPGRVPRFIRAYHHRRAYTVPF